MSRHEIPAKDPAHTVTVGWDNPLQTFYAIVTPNEPCDDDDIILWIGMTPRAIEWSQEMVETLALYADLTGEMIQVLEADRAEMANTPPTPLQQWAANLGMDDD